jgi:hypothetical protein
MITKEDLENLYFVEGLSQISICERVGLTISEVRKLFNKYQIRTRHKGTKKYKLKGLKDKEYNCWLVLGESENKPNHAFCRCKCEKKTERWVPIKNLLNGKSTSCGCKLNKRGDKSHRWKGCGVISGDFFGKLQHHARKRGISFNLSIEYIDELAKKQNFTCALTGEKLIFPIKQKDRTKTASLDRKDSDKPYEPENVQWVLKNVNIMKLTLSEEDFIDVCKKVVAYNEKKESASLWREFPFI